MIHCISFDPGHNTGVVEWEYGESEGEDAKPIKVTTLVQSELDAYLQGLESVELKPEVFVIEEYRVYSHIPHHGSKVETIQVIGQLKAFARRYKIKVVEQRASIKNIAAKWAGVKIPKGHMPDWQAAYLHGYHYLHMTDKIAPRVLKG